MRRRYRWDPKQEKLVEIGGDRSIAGPIVMPDLPGYVSPTTGKWVEGRKARRDDLARSHCRPWEGLESEKRAAASARAEQEKSLDHLAEKMAHEMWRDAPESARRQFRSR